MRHLTPWPIPRPSWRAMLYCATTLTDTAVRFQDQDLDLAGTRTGSSSAVGRVRWLAAGHHVTINVLIVGSQSWCPPFPAGHPIRLTATSAISSGGGGPATERPLPLEILELANATPLDPVNRPIVPALETWTLTTRQTEGTATITGLLRDLAVLAAVAGWPQPPSLRDYHHAGAARGRRRG